jgi:ribonuclease-3
VIVSEELMRRHPRADEGELSWMRQSVVNGASCARAAEAGGLGDALVAAAPPERLAGARALVSSQAVRAGLTEAVIGAAWLDLGAGPTRDAVLDAFGPALDAARPGARDPKTGLQEEAARRRLHVSYELADSSGPPQARRFTSRALVDGRALGEGSGPSKQASEQAAASEALRRLIEEGAAC